MPKTSCFVDDGLQDACGEVPDGCGGTISCADDCNEGLVCVAGDCLCLDPDLCPKK